MDLINKCCAEKIRNTWVIVGGSMNVVHYATNCPECNQFIGLTQTNEEWANEFLESHGLEPIDNDRLKSDRHISSILNDYFTWHNSMGFVSHKPSDINEYIKYKHNERI